MGKNENIPQLPGKQAYVDVRCPKRREIGNTPQMEPIKPGNNYFGCERCTSQIHVVFDESNNRVTAAVNCAAEPQQKTFFGMRYPRKEWTIHQIVYED